MRIAPIILPDCSTLRAYRREGRRLLSILSALLLPVFGSCGKQDLKSELDRTSSWAATTRLAADQRSANAINGAVTSQIADRAGKARSEAEQSLGELAKSDSERTAARAVLDSLGEGLAHLRTVAP